MGWFNSKRWQGMHLEGHSFSVCLGLGVPETEELYQAYKHYLINRKDHS